VHAEEGSERDVMGSEHTATDEVDEGAVQRVCVASTMRRQRVDEEASESGILEGTRGGHEALQPGRHGTELGVTHEQPSQHPHQGAL